MGDLMVALVPSPPSAEAANFTFYTRPADGGHFSDKMLIGPSKPAGLSGESALRN